MHRVTARIARHLGQQHLGGLADGASQRLRPLRHGGEVPGGSAQRRAGQHDDGPGERAPVVHRLDQRQGTRAIHGGDLDVGAARHAREQPDQVAEFWEEHVGHEIAGLVERLTALQAHALQVRCKQREIAGRQAGEQAVAGDDAQRAKRVG